MSEEEKKAIDFFIHECEKYDGTVEIKGTSVGEETRILNTVVKFLKLAEKQQKEIEELKENNKENIKCIEEWINGERMSIHCIHKDSIRAKIEGLEEKQKIRLEFLFSVSRFIIQGKIQGYKELLEDKNNE